MFGLLPKSRILGLLAFQSLAAIEIDLRYDYDATGFFNQPGAKEAMRASADFFEGILTDTLTEINAAKSGNALNTWTAQPRNPATGEILNLVDLVVPENTVIVYLGARDLSGSSTGEAHAKQSYSGFPAFLNNVQSRGQAGALTDPATDFSPWGGSITFDSLTQDGSERAWNFSMSETVPGKDNFVGVALHELCHLLGLGTAKAWNDLVMEGSTFTGAATKVANGGAAPTVQDDKGHWRSTAPGGPFISTTYGSFGTPHGISQRALMAPSMLRGRTEIEALTDLDIAGLIDIGWEVVLPPQGRVVPQLTDGEVALQVPTISNFHYRVQKGDLVTPFTDLSDVIVGDGTVQTYLGPSPSPLRGFYRFVISRPAPAP